MLRPVVQHRPRVIYRPIANNRRAIDIIAELIQSIKNYIFQNVPNAVIVNANAIKRPLVRLDEYRQTLLPNLNYNYVINHPRRWFRRLGSDALQGDLISDRAAFIFITTMTLIGMNKGYQLADEYLTPVPDSVIALLSSTSALTSTLVGTTIGSVTICCLGCMGPIIGFGAGLIGGQTLNIFVPIIGARLHNLLLATAFAPLYRYPSMLLVRAINASVPTLSTVAKEYKAAHRQSYKFMSPEAVLGFLYVTSFFAALISKRVGDYLLPIPEQFDASVLILSILTGSIIADACMERAGNAGLGIGLSAAFVMNQMMNTYLPYIEVSMHRILLTFVGMLINHYVCMFLLRSNKADAPALVHIVPMQPVAALPSPAVIIAQPQQPVHVPPHVPPVVVPPVVVEAPIAQIATPVATAVINETITPGQSVSTSSQDIHPPAAAADPVKNEDRSVAELKARYLEAKGNVATAARIFGVFSPRPHAEVMENLRKKAGENPNGASAYALGLRSEKR